MESDRARALIVVRKTATSGPTALVEGAAIDLNSTPTLDDVAHAAGVSASTASRVLNGSTRPVNASYRARVQEAAARLGYSANLLAQATARGSSSIVALLVADIADPYFGVIAAGVARAADEAGLIMTIAITERDPHREARLIRALRGQRPRAIILAASRTATAPVAAGIDRELEAFIRGGGQVVAFGPSVSGARSVHVDNVAGADALGSVLIQRGYRRAVILAAERGILASDDRLQGFVRGFTSAGGEITAVHRGDFTREGGARSMTRALEEGICPETVVFAVSDVVAIGAMSVVREAGRELGRDIALCGFDDIPACLDVTPHLTTVRVPLERFGGQALRIAIEEDGIATSASLPLEVVLRESTPVIGGLN